MNNTDDATVLAPSATSGGRRRASLTIDPPRDRLAAPLYAGPAHEAHLHLAHGSYSGHYTDDRHTNAPVLISLDDAGTSVLMLACGQCPPTFDARARPIHRRGCPQP